jgi:methylase of polypeptide subunit release factors
MGNESDGPPLVGAQLAVVAHRLAAAGASAPEEEARTLLGALLGVSSALLLARPERHMSLAEVESYGAWAARRAGGEAIAHITGHLAFMGLDIAVSRSSPLPWPGARRLVELALEWARPSGSLDLLAVELGAGCGAISLALAAFEPRFTRIYAVEPSRAALQIAATNGARYLLNLVIQWREGSDSDAVPEPCDLIVCAHGGELTDLLRRAIGQAPATLRRGGALLCSVEARHERAVADLLRRALPAAQVYADPPVEDAVVVVAQTPSPVTGEAEVESRRS